MHYLGVTAGIDEFTGHTTEARVFETESALDQWSEGLSRPVKVRVYEVRPDGHIPENAYVKTAVLT